MVRYNKSSPDPNVWVICKNCICPHIERNQGVPPAPKNVFTKQNMCKNFITTLQETNISHLGKRKLIFKHALSGGYVSSLEGIPYQTKNIKQKEPNQNHRRKHTKKRTALPAKHLRNKKRQSPPKTPPVCFSQLFRLLTSEKKKRHPFLTERV